MSNFAKVDFHVGNPSIDMEQRLSKTQSWLVKVANTVEAMVLLINQLSHAIFVSIDNHSSGYLGMAVQHCVRAYLGPHCILAQKQYCQKLIAQLNSTAFFYPCLCILKL